MNDGVAVINAGSSSVKFALYTLVENGLTLRVSGQLDGLGVGIEPRFVVAAADGAVVVDEPWPHQPRPQMVGRLIDWLEHRLDDVTLRAAGHRIVHGGALYREPVCLTPDMLIQLAKLTPLAPLHHPHNLFPIEALFALHPHLPQVACFDTAFHATKRAEASLLALPRRYLDAGIKRYGFHGLSYEYIASRLPDVCPEVADGRVIVAHLGSGCSMCAMAARTSVDVSVGFSPLDGLMMGTRPGALDAGAVLRLLQMENCDVKALENILYRESGLLGVSGGISSDMRVLLASDAKEAKEAVDLFVYRTVREVGALATAIGGIDALVFTAGIGEHSATIRSRVINALGWLGATLSPEANLMDGPRLTTADSAVSAWVIPTDEDLMIARHTVGCVLS